MNRIKPIVILLALFVCCFGELKAQDIHFSQFYASPLTLNPSLTGRFDGSYRIVGIFRSQYQGISGAANNPSSRKPSFGTPSASFDMPFFVGKKKQDAIGVGAVVTNDFSNFGKFSRLTIQASVAYHKTLGSPKHVLSLGLQAGMIQDKTQGFIFADQFVNGVLPVNPGTSIDQGLADQTNSYFDMNTGLFYSGAFTKDFTLYTGFSLYNLMTPNISLSTNSATEFDLPMRYVVHGGFDWRISKLISMLPGIVYMTQASAKEINVGTNFGFHFVNTPEKRFTWYLGAWYRTGTDIIGMTGFDYNQFRFGFSYDVSTEVDASQATYEFSLMYIGQFLSISDDKVFLFCPRF